MCPLGLQWLRHEDNQPTDSHPHRNSFPLIPMISSLCLDRVDFLVDSRHLYDEVWGLWFRPALLNTSVCVWPGIPPSSLCVFKCMCLWWVVWFGLQLRFNVCVCLTEYFIRNVCHILVSMEIFLVFTMWCNMGTAVFYAIYILPP